MNKVLREEKKFLMNYPEFMRLSHRLEQCLHLDPHSGADGYPVRSLYFDPPAHSSSASLPGGRIRF